MWSDFFYTFGLLNERKMTLDEIRGSNPNEQAGRGGNRIETSLFRMNPQKLFSVVWQSVAKRRLATCAKLLYEALELIPKGSQRCHEHIQNLLEFSNKDLINPELSVFFRIRQDSLVRTGITRRNSVEFNYRSR